MMVMFWPVGARDAEEQVDQATGAGHLGEQVEDSETARVEMAAAVRTGPWRSRNDSTSAIVNLPVLRRSSATRSRATSQATRKPIEYMNPS